MEQDIINWAEQRGLLNSDPSQPLRQLLKASEELGELCRAELHSDGPGIIDGIGDVAITLIIYAAQNELSFSDCVRQAYNEIKNRYGQTVNGTFIKDN